MLTQLIIPTTLWRHQDSVGFTNDKTEHRIHWTMCSRLHRWYLAEQGFEFKKFRNPGSSNTSTGSDTNSKAHDLESTGSKDGEHTAYMWDTHFPCSQVPTCTTQGHSQGTFMSLSRRTIYSILSLLPISKTRAQKVREPSGQLFRVPTHRNMSEDAYIPTNMCFAQHLGGFVCPALKVLKRIHFP